MAVSTNWRTPETVPKQGERAVIYARYSSHNQGEQSIEGQLSEAHKYAAAKGYTIVHEYIDRAQSGRTDNRAEFQKMLKDTAKHQFSVIILWKVDRFGRNREEIALNKYRCKKNGVRVEYVAENIPSTPEGVILEAVLEGFAEYYSLQLSQNIRRGNAESAEKCQSTGSNRPDGYLTGPDKKFIIDEERAQIIRMAYDLVDLNSYTVAEIKTCFDELGFRTRRGKQFTKSTIYGILTNEKYTGVYIYKDMRIPGGMPAIIERDQWERVQEILKKRKRKSSDQWAEADYILTGKLFCGECGNPMFGESGTSRTGAKHNYYTCTGKRRKHSCDRKSVRQQWIEEIVLDAAVALLQDDELLEYIIDTSWAFYESEDRTRDEIEILEKQIQQVDGAINNLVRAIEMGIFSDATKARMDQLELEREALQKEIADRELARGFHLTRDHIAFFLYGLRALDITDSSCARRLIDIFVNSVFVFGDGTVTITFNYSGDSATITLNDLSTSPKSEFVQKTVTSTI